MNVKEMISGLGSNEWATVASSTAAVAVGTWYVKRWWKKRNEAKEADLTAQVESQNQLLKILETLQAVGAFKNSNTEKEVSVDTNTILKALEKNQSKENQPTLCDRVSGLEKRMDAAEEAIVAIVESLVKEKQGDIKEKVSKVKEKAVEQNKAGQSGVDGLDTYMADEIEKIKSYVIESKHDDFRSRLNVLPTILPAEISMESIANIREIVLFAMMCKNKLLGENLFIPRDKAADYLLEAHRNVMAIFEEEKLSSNQLEYAFSRFFSFLKDKSNFKERPILEKTA